MSLGGRGIKYVFFSFAPLKAFMKGTGLPELAQVHLLTQSIKNKIFLRRIGDERTKWKGRNVTTVAFLLFSWVQNDLLALGTRGKQCNFFRKVVQLQSLKLAHSHAKARGDDAHCPLFCA